MSSGTDAHPAAGLLSPDALDHLRRLGEEVLCPADGQIVRRGDTGGSFFVVLSGEVEVRLDDTDQSSLPLARLGPGASFGELALILGESVSADVFALSDCRLLAIPKAGFHQALADNESFRQHLLARLARDLHRTTGEVWDFFRKAEALQLLIRCRDRAEALVFRSAAMRKFERKISDAAAERHPCLITGEAGAGKLLAARTLHEKAFGQSAPLLIIDAQRMAPDEAERLLFGGTAAADPAPHTGGLGAIELARSGTLVVRHVDQLDWRLQERLAAVMRSAETGDTLILATARCANGEISLDPALQTHFAQHNLTVPPLRNRKKDIVPLARFFLDQTEGKARDFDTTAANQLLSMAFQHGNGAQLREIIEFAARCSTGEIVGAEHIFGGLESEERKPGYDLTRTRLIRFLRRSRTLAVIRGLVLVGFGLTIVICLAWPGSRAGTATNGFLWSVWEPAVFALFLLVGSIWCTICPLSAAGRLARRGWSLDRTVPQWLKRGAPWLMLGAFFTILWSEQALHMISHPSAAGLMLLTLITASVIFCVVFTREVWCRYVCPLGALSTSLAPAAVLEIGAKRAVCASNCSSHNCFKGDGRTPGCSVFHHPLNAAESHHCKLCLDCLTSCPNESVTLSLRSPLSGIWSLGPASGNAAPFAVTLLFLTLLFLAVQTQKWPLSGSALAVAGLGTLVLGALIWRLMTRALVRDQEDGDRAGSADVAIQSAFALAVLAWGPLMAYQFGNIPVLASLELSPAAGSLWARLPMPSPWTLAATLQMAIILLAAGLAAIALGRIAVLARRRASRLSVGAWTMLSVGFLMYLGLALALVW